MIRGFLFDLDGVIVDTAKYHFLAWKRLADDLMIPFTPADNERLKGVSRMVSLDIVLSLDNRILAEKEKIALAAQKNSWYVDYITKMSATEILPGVLDFIQEAKARKIKIGLGSASKNAATILERLNIAEFFDAIITGNEVLKAKPDPEVFLLGAKKMRLEAHECVVFEDAEAGIEAAINGKMRCVGIGDPEILKKADIVVKGLDSITVDQALNI